jgi:hypothetical protein
LMNFIMNVLNGSCILGLVLVLLNLVLVHDIVKLVCNVLVAFNIII